MTPNKRAGIAGTVALTDATYRRNPLACRYCGLKVESLAAASAARTGKCPGAKHHALVAQNGA